MLQQANHAHHLHSTSETSLTHCNLVSNLIILQHFGEHPISFQEMLSPLNEMNQLPLFFHTSHIRLYIIADVRINYSIETRPFFHRHCGYLIRLRFVVVVCVICLYE